MLSRNAKQSLKANNGSIQHALRCQKLKAGSALQARDKEMLMPKTGLEETERLVHSTHEQHIRIRAYEIYLQRGGQPGNELEIGFR